MSGRSVSFTLRNLTILPLPRHTDDTELTLFPQPKCNIDGCPPRTSLSPVSWTSGNHFPRKPFKFSKLLNHSKLSSASGFAYRSSQYFANASSSSVLASDIVVSSGVLRSHECLIQGSRYAHFLLNLLTIGGMEVCVILKDDVQYTCMHIAQPGGLSMVT